MGLKRIHIALSSSYYTSVAEIGDAILYFIQGQGDVCEMIMMILKVVSTHTSNAQ